MASKRLPVRFRSTPPLSGRNTRVPNGWKSVFQTDDEGSIPSIRSDEPSSWRGCSSAKRQVRVRFPLGSLRQHETDRDGLVTLSSLIRSSHCVRFAGDPLKMFAALAV